MRALWLLLLVGCSRITTTAERNPVCKPGDPSIDAAMFAQLTAQRWGYCGSNNGLCLSLSADGNYATVEGFDDYFTEGKGRWNFLARDATSGLVCFDNGSITDFELTPDGLVWRPSGLLPRRDTLPTGGTRDELDELDTPELFTTLTANPWQRQNELDLFYQPTSFAVARDGTWNAEWRYGACRASGTLSIVPTPTGTGAARESLRAHPIANVCDPRNGGMSAAITDIDDYAPPNHSDEQFLSFRSYSDSYGLTVRASWQSSLRAASTKQWALELTNTMANAQTVTSIGIWMTPIAETHDGYTTTGTATTLVDQTLAEALASHATFETDVTLALPPAGLYQLSIVIESGNPSSSMYLNQASYVVELSP